MAACMAKAVLAEEGGLGGVVDKSFLQFAYARFQGSRFGDARGKQFDLFGRKRLG